MGFSIAQETSPALTSISVVVVVVFQGGQVVPLRLDVPFDGPVGKALDTFGDGLSSSINRLGRGRGGLLHAVAQGGRTGTGTGTHAAERSGHSIVSSGTTTTGITAATHIIIVTVHLTRIHHYVALHIVHHPIVLLHHLIRHTAEATSSKFAAHSSASKATHSSSEP